MWSLEDVDEDEEGIPEAATQEPEILSPEEYARRATRRLDRREHEEDERQRWPQPKDPLRPPGESSPAPEHRAYKF